MQPFLFSTTAVLTVGALMRHLQNLLAEDAIAQDVAVRGEISNFKAAPSGHLYFSLKDREATVRCVMWKGQALALPRLPREGESVQVQGYVSLYDARGDLQLYVNSLTQDGIGELWQQFEALKRKLEAEGLFATERKRPLPTYPSAIGIATSAAGAALQDMVRTLRQRWTLAEVVVAGCQVQGADAPRQIVQAIRRLNRIRSVQVIIVARGGGSVEDLWAFNDEAVARAICASRQPVISGVGHETDFTIADFVADLRAATPTAAAAACTKDRREVIESLNATRATMARRLFDQIASERAGLDSTARALRRLSPRDQISTKRQRIDEYRRALLRAIRHVVELHRERVDARSSQLAAVNPLAVLRRGYAIVQRDGHIISQSAAVHSGDRLRVRVSDGAFGAVVTDRP